jgi:hypothetical protein
MNQYTAGQVIEFTAQFNDDSGNPVDPTTVAFKYRVGIGATTTLTYGGASVPAVGVAARTGVGTYEAQVDTTSLPAGVQWTYEWVSTALL